MKMVFIPVFLLLQINNIKAQENDFSYQKTAKFIIEEGDSGKFLLSSDINVENTYLSERSKNFFRYSEYTHFFNPMEDFTWEFKDESFDSDETSFIIPEFEDVFISTDKIYYLTVPGNIKKGDKLSYNFSQKYIDISYFPVIKIPNLNRLENFRIIIEHPDDIKPEFSVFFTRNKFRYKTRKLNGNSTLFETGMVPEEKELAYFPFNDEHAYVFVSIKRNGRNINPSTPAEFVDWYKTIASLEPSLDSAHKNILSEEISKADSDTGKLRIIYDYVRKNIRYIAEEQTIYSFVPRDPNLVLDRGYGDCKERASLVSAVAREHGIKVYMACVASDEAPGLDQVFLTKYNHVICAYNTGEKILFFDPTSKYCEFGNLPENDIGKEALILNPGDPQTVFIDAPLQNKSVIIEINAHFDSLNKAKAKVILHNDYFSAALHAMRELTDIKLENFLSGVLNSSLYKISLDYFKLESENYNSVTFSAEADLSQYMISSSAKNYIPKTPFIFYDNEILTRKSDKFDIYPGKRITGSLKIELNAPGYLLQPDSLMLFEDSTLFFNTRAETAGTSKMNFIYEINQQSKKYTSPERNRFLDFCDQYLKNKTNMFIIRKKQ